MGWAEYNAAQNYDYCDDDYTQADSEIKMWSILKRYDGRNAAQIQTEIRALTWPNYPADFELSGDIDLVEEDIDCLFTGYQDDDCMWDERKEARESFWAVFGAGLLEAAE